MALTEQDRESIELLATRIYEKVQPATLRAVEMMIAHHKDTCEYGMAVRKARWMAFGAALAVIVLSAGSAGAGAAIAMHLFGG